MGKQMKGDRMKSRCKMAVAFLLILVVLVPLSALGCGGGGGGGKVTIHIGELTDLTGAASPALKQITFITEDMIRYYNDENIIPGVKLKLDAYDTQFNPARYSLGYDWCKEKGDKVIITIIADAPIMLKPFAARDKIVLAAMAGSPELFTPPGWVFGFSSDNEDSAKILLHWIVGNDWPNKGQGTPKIAIMGWDDTQSISVANAIEAYLGTHQNEYDYVDRLITPVGTMTFTSEAKRLKDEGCDYIAVPSGTILAPFLRDLRAAGSQATLLDCVGSMGSFQQMYVQMVGWDLLDGCYSTSNSFSWSDPSDPIVQLATTLVHRYHSSSEAQDLMVGNTYVGPATMMVGILEILQQAVKNLGAENFNGQAYYDAATNYKTTGSLWGNYPEFSFSETRRKLMDHSLISGFKGGDVKAYVTISGWLPDIVD
jgi:ABC-type branched-subunit amino acid transport system substrate-binding protein